MTSARDRDSSRSSARIPDSPVRTLAAGTRTGRDGIELLTTSRVPKPVDGGTPCATRSGT